MNVCVPVTTEGDVSRGFGRAHRVAVATVVDGQMTGWQEFDVGWDTLHDEATEGAHHARIARFVNDHQIDAVVAANMGDGMRRMLTTMKVAIAVGADGDARSAVLKARLPAH